MFRRNFAAEPAGFTAIQYFKAKDQGLPDDAGESLIFECMKPL